MMLPHGCRLPGSYAMRLMKRNPPLLGDFALQELI